MATEVHEFTVIVPAGTPVASPLTFNLAMSPRIIDQVEVQVPPGPRGEVGFAIGQAGEPIFPFETGAWVVTDDRTLSWDLEGANTSGAWQIFAYNTGSYDHTLYIRFKTRLTGGGGPTQAPGFIESTVLSG